MAKAVLVMDMPERCDKCSLLLKIPQKDGLALCLARPASGQQEEYNPKHEKSWKPNWCPLRELPEKIPGLESGYESINRTLHREGWNDCLDRILGEIPEKGEASKRGNPAG